MLRDRRYAPIVGYCWLRRRDLFNVVDGQVLRIIPPKLRALNMTVSPQNTERITTFPRPLKKSQKIGQKNKRCVNHFPSFINKRNALSLPVIKQFFIFYFQKNTISQRIIFVTQKQQIRQCFHHVTWRMVSEQKNPRVK